MGDHLGGTSRSGFIGLREIGFVPSQSKLYRPAPGLVARRALVDRINSRDGDVVVVTAPAGYGKSTLVAELAAADPRPTAWVSLTAADNDPAALLTYVALALDGIEPVEPDCVAALWARPPTAGSLALQQFSLMLAAPRRPFTLVLDDVHELVDRDVLDVVRVVVDELPPGCRIVLAGRAAGAVPLGRIRVRRRLVEVGPADLAFGEQEAAQLFTVLGVDVPPAEVARLVERSEGWPVALYLAALAHGSGRVPLAQVGDDFTGDHRFLVDFFSEELLGDLDADVATFLGEASCLDRLNGELCDAVLGRTGSAALLERLRRQNLLVLPLDDRRQWYRFHHMLAEFLRAELAQRDPARGVVLHRRASVWYHEGGDAEAAIRHAVLSGDVDRAEWLVTHWFGRVAGAGLYPAVDQWLTLFTPEDLVARPGLMVAAAHGRFRGGESGAAIQWLDRAVAALPERHPDVHGALAPVLIAAARAIIVPLSPAEMLAEATYAHDHADLGEGHPLSCLAMGAALFLLGKDAEAVRRLDECLGAALQRPLVQASALAQLAVIEVDHGRWAEATALARRARQLLGASITLPTGNLVLATSVLVETHAGASADDMSADLQLCRRHLLDLVGAAAWLNVQCRVALARAAVCWGVGAEAAGLLDEADGLLATMPGAIRVEDQVATLRREMTARWGRTSGSGPHSLTTAELRVLRLLPTHLSIAEIADRLFVSRNTVKSQTIAVYRKLGTSSRSGAVDVALTAGLLEPVARRG